SNGQFQLIDVNIAIGQDGSTDMKVTPDRVVILASKGNRWGFAVNDLTSNNKSLTVRLSQTTSAPKAPPAPIIAQLKAGAATLVARPAVIAAIWKGPGQESQTVNSQEAGNTQTARACRGEC